MNNETYISVDVETAGPVPAQYALLSIGACLVDDASKNFYVELIPDRENFNREALNISRLDMESLKKNGTDPIMAMRAFQEWVKSNTPPNNVPVFVAFNAPFDWMFINDYFIRYLGENPFGHSALDIKAYFMGQAGVDWKSTSMKQMAGKFLNERHLTHNALNDAQDQAEIFRKLMREIRP